MSRFYSTNITPLALSIVLMFIIVQTASADVVDSTKWSFSFSTFGTLSYRYIQADSGYSWVKELKQKHETYKTGYSINFGIGYKLTPSITLGIGLGFANRGYRTKTDTFDSGTLIDPRYGYNNSNTKDIIGHLSYRFLFMDLPFFAQYTFKSGNWAIDIKPFVGFSYLVKSDVIVVNKANGKLDVNDYKVKLETLNYLAGVEMLVRYSVLNNLSIGLGPRFDIHVNSITNSPVRSYPYNIGLGLILTR